MRDNDWMSYRSRTEDKRGGGRGFVTVVITSALTVQVCFQVCVCAGKLTSSTLEHIQVQAPFHYFYICIVSKWLGNCCQLTYPIAAKTPMFCQGVIISAIVYHFSWCIGFLLPANSKVQLK